MLLVASETESEFVGVVAVIAVIAVVEESIRGGVLLVLVALMIDVEELGPIIVEIVVVPTELLDEMVEGVGGGF